MKWLTLIKLVFTVFDKFFDLVERHELLNEGELRAVRKITERLDQRAQDAIAARATATDDGLREPDRYERS